MNLQTLRTPSHDPRDPLAHALEPMQVAGRPVAVALVVRLAADGAWRGRLNFTEVDARGEVVEERSTAEIFCGVSEDDLWQSVRALGEHHLRDLHRSLA